jgi:hypothetical protein
MFKYFMRRAAYDLVRASVRAAARPKVEVAPGTHVWWRHPSGYSVPAQIVEIADNRKRVRIQVIRNGKPETLRVKPDRLYTTQP